MRAHWETVVEIDRPIEKVFEFVNDVFNMPRLRGTTLAVRWLSPGPIRPGSTYRGRSIILGYEVGITGEVTVWNPPHEAVASIVGGGVRYGTIRESLEETRQGTRLTRSLDLDIKPLASLGWVLLGWLLKRRATNASRRIKTIMETAAAERLEAPANASPGAAADASISGLSVRRTFLFTDIVGSTALVGVIGDAAWRDLRRWHDATLRRLFQIHHGHEIDHAGDGFLVAFDRAGDGVACAVDIQRTLVDHRRGAGFAPEIRMGLHTGEVQPDGQAFAGTAVHVASRVAASASGGQILATGPTIAEAQVTPASPAEELRLKGIGDPVSVVSIAW